jgi:excisionase family DNA binding protein
MRLLTTRELASAIGVSESSIKRWADEGVIRASRTAGGHRRIPLPEALRFVREGQISVVRPEVLGLEQPAAAPFTANPEELLYAHLRDGDETAAHELVNSLLAHGFAVATLVDGPLRTALARIGELWRHQPEGLLIEHRATEIATRLLNAIRVSLPKNSSGPVAVGGAPSGDPYVVPSLATATVLAAEGWRPVNFGPDTPLDSLARAAAWLDPRLLWISFTVAPLTRRHVEQVADLARTVAGSRIDLIVGGQAVTPGIFPSLPNLKVFSSMTEMTSYVRALTPRDRVSPPHPRRRRPTEISQQR